MGERPGKEWSIDRIDNEGDYCPENCKWATRAEQDRNTSRSVWVTYRGERIVMADLAERFGLNRAAMRWRIKHWPEEKWDIPAGSEQVLKQGPKGPWKNKKRKESIPQEWHDLPLFSMEAS